jgi:uncharacterized protein
VRFVLAGSSGFLGTAWTAHLEAAGHEVTRLVRRPAQAGESRWDPYANKVDLDLIEAADVVANLAGAPLPRVALSASYRKTFADSRVVTTRTLADAIAATRGQTALVAQNGIAGYGDRGDAVVTEATATDAETFLAQVTRDWAEATVPATEAGARVVILRTSVVLDKDSLTLKVMKIPFLLGLGGKIGDGKQYFPTISLSDWLRAVTFLAESDSASGVYNITGPNPTTNEEFTKALASRLHRPSFLRVPERPLRMTLGPVAPEVLSSLRVEPTRLLEAGFAFEHPTLESRLTAALAD